MTPRSPRILSAAHSLLLLPSSATSRATLENTASSGCAVLLAII